MMTEVFQFALEERGERNSGGSRTRHGEKLGDDTAMNAKNMHSLSQMCFRIVVNERSD